MMTERNSVKMLEDYAESRRIYKSEDGKNYESKLSNRFYAVEAAFTVTGSNADHRLRLKSAEVIDFAFALAKKIAAKTNVNAEVKKVIDSFAASENFGKLTKAISGTEFLDTLAEELFPTKEKVLF